MNPVAPVYPFASGDTEGEEGSDSLDYPAPLAVQTLHGRTYRTLDELRAAVTDFARTYNHQRSLETSRFLTPVEARQQHSCLRPIKTTLCTTNEVRYRVKFWL